MSVDDADENDRLVWRPAGNTLEEGRRHTRIGRCLDDRLGSRWRPSLAH
jgi:hypothetical protein